MGKRTEYIELYAKCLFIFNIFGNWFARIVCCIFHLQSAIEGITKSVQFDENGLRSEFEVQILTLNTLGLVPIATWTTEFGVKKLPDAAPAAAEDPSAISLKNRTFIILTSLVSHTIL